MISFKTFISEAAIHRKIENGYSDTPIQHPGAKVIHHDPSNRMTIYHLTTPEACHDFGTNSKWCTATKKKDFAHEYVRKGKVFAIHKGESRFQAYHPVSKKENLHYNPSVKEFRDTDNRSLDPQSQVHVLGNGNKMRHHEVESKMKATKHKRYNGPDWEPPPHPFQTMPEHEVVQAVKNMSSQERRDHFHAVINPEHLSDESEIGLSRRFNKQDLHHFHDDTDHASLIAHYGDLNKVAHTMGNHPDHEIRRIVQQRIQRVGGMKNILPPSPAPSNFQHHPDQFPMKFGKIQQGKKQQ